MDKITNKKIYIIDAITLSMILLFPLVPSYDHELFMTLLCLIGALTFFSNLSLIKFNYKEESNIEQAHEMFVFMWAKMFIFSMLLNACVESFYLNWALSNLDKLNIYSHKAIIGWELMVHFYNWVLFYVPIIAASNALLFMITSALLLMFRNKTLMVLIKNLVKDAKEKMNTLKTLIQKFNSKVINVFKLNKQKESLGYLINSKELFVNNKKAQLPPLFFF